uniref:Zinc finger, C3HC4 type (RING finger) containing protein, putative n=1 Tax=Theileria annulata TaxID=5874 RepID=A0A3B0MZA3_THEAN
MDILNEFTVSELIDLEGALCFGLTPFEVLRTPRTVDTEKFERLETTLNDSGLREELTCAICSGIISKCVVIKTCLHRFCSNCIEKCVRVGTRGCPKCRKHVPSRRFFRNDPIYDSLISRIISNVEVFEELRMKNDPTINAIRSKYLNENPKIHIDHLKQVGELHEGDFSLESKFDNKVYVREVKEKRREVLKLLPKPIHFTKLQYKILSDDTLPQILPNHDHDYIPSLNVTLALLRNITYTMSHEILNIYYGSCHLKL